MYSTRLKRKIFRTHRLETFLSFNIIQSFLEKHNEGRSLHALQPVTELMTKLVKQYKQWPEIKLITNLTNPLSVFVHHNNIFVCETFLHHILVIDKETNTQTILHTWGDHQSSLGNEIGQFNHPISIAVSNQGVIAVCDTGNNRVQLFESDGTFKIQFNTHLSIPSGIAFTYDGEYLAISDTGNHRIQIRKITGEIITNIGQLGDQPGSLNTPVGITITKTNIIFVCDNKNHRIQVFGSHGEFLKIIGQNDLLSPISISVLPSGEIFVSDNKKLSIQGFRIYNGFNKENKIVGTTCSKFFEKKVNSLASVYGVFIDKNGDMISSHPNCRSISILSNFNYHQHYKRKQILKTTNTNEETNEETKEETKEEIYLYTIKY